MVQSSQSRGWIVGVEVDDVRSIRVDVRVGVGGDVAGEKDVGGGVVPGLISAVEVDELARGGLGGARRVLVEEEEFE